MRAVRVSRLIPTSLAVAAALLAAPVSAANSKLAVSFDKFTYSGTVTDPLGGTHAIETAFNGPRATRPDARDGRISVRSGALAKYGADKR